MDEVRLANALAGLVGKKLAADISADFAKLRRDVATNTLERASAGKFVESFVQCLQQIATGKHHAKPDVDGYLTKKAGNEATIPEGLRVVGARIARVIYTLRNKRNIAYKNPVDPNRFDLDLAHHSAAWIMAELLRNATRVSMEEAGALIERVQTPVGTLVEEIDGARIVHAKTSVRGEILILLHSRYPERVQLSEILRSLKARSQGSVRNRLSEGVNEKSLHGDKNSGYRLTTAGHNAAVKEIQSLSGE